MSVNKNALLRYNTIDRCLRNTGRRYYINDLLQEVNTRLIEDNPQSSGIQLRQLRSDLQFMKSEAGYAAPIVAHKDGQKAFYRYDDLAFSINNSPLNETEAEQLRNALAILQRFEGAPEFEWINEMAPMLQDQFKLKNSSKRAMAYESNIDYQGYRFITPLFNAIVNNRVLKLRYAPFAKEPFDLTFHPYFLKQYNNRWFVFGLNQEIQNPKWNLALDRIEGLTEVNESYIPTNIDWEDHFYDIVGVTRPEADLVEVELLFPKEQAPYISTKPIHPSQKNKIMEDGSLHVRLNIIPNFELEMKILSFGERVKVLAPLELREKIKARITMAATHY